MYKVPCVTNTTMPVKKNKLKEEGTKNFKHVAVKKERLQWKKRYNRFCLTLY